MKSQVNSVSILYMPFLELGLVFFRFLQIGGLKVKLQREGERTESQNKVPEEKQVSGALKELENKTDHDPDHYYFRASISKDSKDRSSDSDCSVILNDQNSLNGAISLEDLPQQQQKMVVVSPFTSSFRSDWCYSMSSSATNCLPFENSTVLTNTQKACHQQFLKMEESSNYFNAEEPCCFFSDEVASMLSWYSPEQWN